MRIIKGLLLYDKEGEIVWVVPHSGPALETPTSRDARADTVASLCWMKVGGRLVVSAMPRKRALGIDFNRDAPPPGKSVEYYPMFMKDEQPEKLQEYREKYAFSAADMRDHARRLKIYKDFWSSVREPGQTVVFVHTKFTRLKNFPSIMDIVAYEDYGFSRKILAPIVRRVNRKYSAFFAKLSENYRHSILLQQKRIVKRITEIYGSLQLKDVKIEYKRNLQEDLKIVRKFADARRLKRLDKHFTPKNFILAARSALHNGGPPKITVESIFKGSHARHQAMKLSRRRNVISIESDAFLNYWYPNEAAHMILDIVNEIKPMRKITNYLHDTGS